jgi:hypothetical protein
MNEKDQRFSVGFRVNLMSSQTTKGENKYHFRNLLRMSHATNPLRRVVVTKSVYFKM